MNDTNETRQPGQTIGEQCAETGYKSVTILASEHSNPAEYLRQLERERDDMLDFIRQQVELWENDGDSGFPLYDHGKRLLSMYPEPNISDEHNQLTGGCDSTGGL